MKYRIKRGHLDDCPALTEIWEESVKATHDFLSAEDFEHYKLQLPLYFDRLQLFVLEYTDGDIGGFAGIEGDKLEMLFVRDRGKGIGKILLDFAVKERYVTKVDVNRQNEPAVGFYMKYGFRPTDMSPADSEGKPYPIMHMGIESERPQMPHGHPGGHPDSGHGYSQGHPAGDPHSSHGNK